jgi:hypothetical protein
LPGSPPPSGPATGAAQIWGSLPQPGQEDRIGTAETGWFALPAITDQETLAVMAAGRLSGGNSLRVEYGQSTGGGNPRVVGSEVLDDGRDSQAWRTFRLDATAAHDEGADSVRLVAEDRSSGTGGWLAFTGPSVLPLVPLQDYIPDGAAVGEAWQISFLFPCQRQPDVRFGITEPVQYGVVWRNGPAGNGLDDNTWQVFRGGLFAPVQRSSGVTELAAVLPDWPDVTDWQAFRFVLPYDTGAYDLTVDRVTRTGWAGPEATG